MENNKTRCMQASAKFLERKGHELLEIDNDKQMIVVFDEEENTLVFVHVAVSDEGDFAESISRREFEQYAMEQLPHFDDITDVMVRFDNIGLKILEGDRALLRHHINCLD